MQKHVILITLRLRRGIFMNEIDRSRELYRYISKELREVRKSKNLNLTEVSSYLGISPSFLSQIERGNRDMISLYYYLKLAEYFNVDIKEIIKNAQMRMEIEQSLDS